MVPNPKYPIFDTAFDAISPIVFLVLLSIAGEGASSITF